MTADDDWGYYRAVTATESVITKSYQPVTCCSLSIWRNTDLIASLAVAIYSGLKSWLEKNLGF